jgi:hypothetical protein
MGQIICLLIFLNESACKSLNEAALLTQAVSLEKINKQAGMSRAGPHSRFTLEIPLGIGTSRI